MDSRLRGALALFGAAIAGLSLMISADDRAAGDGVSLDRPRITAAQRNASAAYASTVPPGDRRWIEAAVAAARPEAQRLIAEVDGLVTYQVHRGDPLGVTRSRVSPAGASFEVSFDVNSLDGDRGQDRTVTVLHEYGHVIDLAIVPQALDTRLQQGIPRTGGCGNYGGTMIGACADERPEWTLVCAGRWPSSGPRSPACP